MSQASDRTNELAGQFESFLRRYYEEDVKQLANENGDSLTIDVLDLYRYEPALVDDYLEHPERVQAAADEALRQFPLPVDVPIDAHVRITGWSEEDTVSVGGYGSDSIGTAQPVQGQVAKVADPHPSAEEATFVCERCGAETIVPQSDDPGLDEPYQCESCEREGPFQLDESRTTWRDRQTIRLQEPPEEVVQGAGSTIDAVVYDDLVGSVTPGDRATITGRVSVTGIDDSPEFRLEGSAVEIEETDYDDTEIQKHKERILELANGEHGDPYDLITKSIAPRIHGEGYDEIKLALALQLFSANRVEYADGGDGRGRFHVLLLGDPGVGKSALVEAVDEIAPRSVFTSGEGVSKVGLTASVVPDDFGAGKWSLEAGPIVKANEGVCCVDEIDKAPEEAVEGLHTALEKQVVTVSKASFNGVQLQARTSFLAAGNPLNGRFDPYEPVPEQIDLSPTLLSRFDLMFMLSDEPDYESDREIVREMIRDRQEAIRFDRGDVSADQLDADPPISREVLRAWIAYVHERNPRPAIEDEQVRDDIAEFIADLRDSAEGEDLDNQVPVTYRKAEGIERLAEASARVRLSDTVEREDVQRAVQLVLKSMRDVEYDPNTGTFDADIKETGQSRAQTERLTDLESIVRDIQGQSGGAPIDEIVQTATEMGYDEDRIRSDIEGWLNKGDAYEPSSNEIRLV